MNDTTRFDQALESLRQDPAFDLANAYERTKMYCALLTRHGRKIPYWGAIRDAIGKGSGTDINRGVRDFRVDHARALTAMPAVPPDVPAELAGPLRDIWAAAIAHAQAAFDAARLRLQEAVEQSENARFEAETRLSDAESKAREAEQNAAALQSALADAQAARADAMAMAAAAQDAASASAARLIAADQTFAAERAAFERKIAEMVERLDGLQRHALKQIDDARQDFTLRQAQSRADLDAANAAARQAESARAQALADLSAARLSEAALREDVARARAEIERLQRRARQDARDRLRVSRRRQPAEALERDGRGTGHD